MKRVLSLLFVLFLASVRSYSADPTVDSNIAKLDVLYDSYLKGNLATARKSLMESVVTLDKSNPIKPAAKAHSFWLTFSRLHVLELHAGNTNLADAHLLKAQYWMLLKFEAAGNDAAVSIIKVREFTSAKCLTMVMEFDKKANAGRGPKYLDGEP